ncbi:hypothetical protein F9L04_23920 [Brucella anthropi]|uniref:Bro-N domain-containing protein n=1 Tax=Brucella anthropi TaxID=529 RepID=A0A6L3YYQ3_BRUAN|nr:hypothetical protein F9L04_23920 [Brucella anthropi]
MREGFQKLKRPAVYRKRRRLTNSVSNTERVSVCFTRIRDSERRVIFKKSTEVSANSALSSLFVGNPFRLALFSESALYKLAIRSTVPEAAKFQDWIAHDVLPAIRKDGLYVRGEEKVLTERLWLAKCRWKRGEGLTECHPHLSSYVALWGTLLLPYLSRMSPRKYMRPPPR